MTQPTLAESRRVNYAFSHPFWSGDLETAESAAVEAKELKKKELSFSNSALLTEVMAMSIYRDWVGDVFNSTI